jgi:hypothetical protein
MPEKPLTITKGRVHNASFSWDEDTGQLRVESIEQEWPYKYKLDPSELEKCDSMTFEDLIVLPVGSTFHLIWIHESGGDIIKRRSVKAVKELDADGGPQRVYVTEINGQDGQILYDMRHISNKDVGPNSSLKGGNWYWIARYL